MSTPNKKNLALGKDSHSKMSSTRATSYAAAKNLIRLQKLARSNYKRWNQKGSTTLYWQGVVEHLTLRQQHQTRMTSVLGDMRHRRFLRLMAEEQYETLFNEMFTNRGHTADEFNQLYTRLVDDHYVADIQTRIRPFADRQITRMETLTVMLNNAASKAFLREAMTGTVLNEVETYGSDVLE